MADNESKKIGDILDDIEKDLKKYAEDSFGEYGYSGKISELKSEIKKNLEKTKDTVDEQSYEENIRKLAKKLKNPDKAIGDYTNFEEMLNGVKKDAYKGVENLKQSSKAKSSSKSIDETNKKIGVKKRNRLMPTKIGKKTTLKQKIALILSDGIIMKVPFVEYFVDEQLNNIKSEKTPKVTSEDKRKKFLKTISFKGKIDNSKVKETSAQAKMKTAEQSKGR